MDVPFFRREYDTNSVQRVTEVIASGFLTSGSVGRSVEKQVSDYFGFGSFKLTSSWTTAWQIVLDLENIGPGDEVIMPSLTFVSCANMVVKRGATVVFCDVDYRELVCTPETIRPLVNDRTKLILLVHLYGLMCPVSEIVEEFGEEIKIYEDCAHAFSASRDNVRPGQLTDGAIFSFYATKNISCGEGGGVLTKSERLADLIEKMRLHGMSASAYNRYTTTSHTHWDVETPGYKANLPDVLAALLPEQIDTVAASDQRRSELYLEYQSLLEPLSEIRTQTWTNASVNHSHHLFTVGVAEENRDPLIGYLKQNGVGVAVNFRSILDLSAYKNNHSHTPNADLWGRQTISLPFFENLALNEQQYVVALINDWNSK